MWYIPLLFVIQCSHRSDEVTKAIIYFSGHNSLAMPFAPTNRNPVSLPCFVKHDGDFCRLQCSWLVVQYLSHLLTQCLVTSMLFHSMFFACCVGEADNPGPKKACTRFAITNPTAVYGKLDKICAFDADAIFVSESSATTVVQKDCTHELAKHKYSSFGLCRLQPKSKLWITDPLTGEKRLDQPSFPDSLQEKLGVISMKVFGIPKDSPLVFSDLVNSKFWLSLFTGLPTDTKKVFVQMTFYWPV